MWIASKCCKSILPSGHCLEESGAWPAFSSLVHFRGAQEASHRCPDKEKTVGGRRGLGDGSSSWEPTSPYPTSWVRPRGTLCAQTIETTSSVPGDLAECEWLTLPNPTPSRGTEQWGRTRKPLTEAEKRESVLYMVLI